MSALLPPVTVRIADDAALTDLNVKGMMSMATDPYIRGLFGMQDVIEGLCATGKQKICLLPRISRRRNYSFSSDSDPIIGSRRGSIAKGTSKHVPFLFRML